MPFYEYVCDSCGHEFETMQSINAEPLTTCEKCGKSIRRVIFPSAIVYKGSGFYSTEYGKSRFNHPTGKKKDSAEKATSDSSSSAEPSKDSSSSGSDSVKSPNTTKSPKASSSGSTKAAATNS